MTLTETQARLLADQIHRMARKSANATTPLDHVFAFAAKMMAQAGVKLGYEFLWSPAGVSWRKVNAEVPTPLDQEVTT